MSEIEPANPIESPCNRICTLNENDICVGCYRHIDEIVGWGRATEEERRVILEWVEKRKKDTPNM